MEPMSPYWQDLTSPEAAALAKADAVAVLPLAAIEQHGPHLPLSTDLDIGRGLLDETLPLLPAWFPVTVLPALAIGTSTEHASFPGTLSLAPETAMSVIADIGRAVAVAGLRRLVLFNSHGGNRQIADLAGLALRRAHGLLVVKANYFRFRPPSDALPAAELRHGIHGGALETALMLHFRPDAVRRDQFADAPSLGHRLAASNRYLGPEGDASIAWLAEDLNPTGVVGNAGLATPEMGARLAAHFAAVLAQVLVETRRCPLPPMVDG
jgi:creatinine amidohydrolase